MRAYPELAAVVGAAVPDLRERTPWGSGSPGQYREAGLPNITGVHPIDTNASTISGAFLTDGVYIGKQSASQTGGAMLLQFDASRCSPVYGRSATVQPAAYTVRFLIRAQP